MDYQIMKDQLKKVFTVIENPSIEITKILKIKITIKEWRHLIVKDKILDTTFAGQNFIGKKTVQMLRKI